MIGSNSVLVGHCSLSLRRLDVETKAVSGKGSSVGFSYQALSHKTLISKNRNGRNLISQHLSSFLKIRQRFRKYFNYIYSKHLIMCLTFLVFWVFSTCLRRLWNFPKTGWLWDFPETWLTLGRCSESLMHSYCF